MRSRGGFSLVELLVAIAVTAVLVAILLPVLRHARVGARTVACVSHARSNAQAFHNYSAIFDDYLPFLGTRAPESWQAWKLVTALPGRSQPAWANQRLWWPAAVNVVLTGKIIEPSQFCPSSGEYRGVLGGENAGEYVEQLNKYDPLTRISTNPTMAAHYWMGLGFITDPDVWNDNPYPQPDRTPVRFDQVTFPGLKGMLIESVARHVEGAGYADSTTDSDDLPAIGESGDRGVPYTTAFVDGRAQSVGLDDFAAPFDDYIKNWYGSRPTPVFHTKDGFQGVDLGGGYLQQRAASEETTP